MLRAHKTTCNTPSSLLLATSPPELRKPHQTSDLTFLYYMSGAALVTLHLVAIPFAAPGFRKFCLPYVAANSTQLGLLTKHLRSNGARNMVDLGSGDGVVCVHVAKKLGIKTVGYELNPWLVLSSRLYAHYEGVSHLTEFHHKDLFKGDIRKTDAVCLFVVPSMMESLEAKFMEELRNDAMVYAVRFPLKSWEAGAYEKGEKKTQTKGYNVNQIWVYSKPFEANPSLK
mmetsp:Transcript_26508/g.40133  ORF Transcript_26508/g.40133 Transcript_26508/m.40133 type:complete len:228 (-) Transcript_26508:199-882(-)